MAAVLVTPLPCAGMCVPGTFFFLVPAAVWQGVQKFVMEDDVCFWTIVSLLFHVKTSSIVS